MPQTHDSRENQLKIRASWISLGIGVLLLVIKFAAFSLTKSQAIFSDAMESIVNVVAASLALFVIYFASKPADRDHPYGHGKVEYFSAAFEGGLISFAGVLIFAEAVQELISGSEVQSLGIGIGLTLLAGFINFGLGQYLKITARRLHSTALEASAHHILSDFWTSLGIVAGLGLVALTGYRFLDPVIAIIVGGHLAWTGFGLVRKSTGALMDAEDEEVIRMLVGLFQRSRFPGIIRIHATKVIRSGNFHHIDAHVVVPEFWTVTRAHFETEKFEDRVMREYPLKGAVRVHVDPCRQFYCANCDVQDCEIRKKPFEKLKPFDVEELVSPNEPDGT